MGDEKNSFDYSGLIEEFKLLGKHRLFESAKEEEIDLFENTNKIVLPKKYKAWLKLTDGGELFLPAGLQLYGVVHTPSIDINNDDRPDGNYVVLGTLASGDPILFKKGSEQICIYNHTAGRIEADEVYDDFYAFLSDLKEIVNIEE